MSKRLNEMDDLRDMGRFPVPIYVGATGNVLMTIVLTYLVRGRSSGPRALAAWGGAVILANLLPVFVLRSRMDEETRYPEIEEMDFFSDQHKFSRWVYGVASANMLFWISLAWLAFSRRRDGRTLAVTLLLAFVCTFFPAWVRLFGRP
ncbi:hypothetical protein GBA65_09285 [Rubrobacter marinus]|uniref:Uncharacterized protein n=1 Tax=Rubrobacter marinus TaxID=2653852 RepID=A0A6G8PWS9_9ACTN|nr:hypothetical protein [Rubrobacter marinus]QIN78679.1 hypothetical protein GBA65_09285 [Rubrobacter marinus]